MTTKLPQDYAQLLLQVLEESKELSGPTLEVLIKMYERSNPESDPETGRKILYRLSWHMLQDAISGVGGTDHKTRVAFSQTQRIVALAHKIGWDGSDPNVPKALAAA